MRICCGRSGHLHEEVAFNDGKNDCPFCRTLDELDQALADADTLRGQLEEMGREPRA